MAKFARVEDGIVQEIIEAEALPPFHTDIAEKFFEAPSSVALGWQFNGESFSLPPEPSVEESLPQKLNESFSQLQPEERAQLYTAKAAVLMAIQEGDIEAAGLIIESLDASSEFKQAMGSEISKALGQ